MSAIHRYTVQSHMVNTPPFSCALKTESYTCGTLTEPAAVGTVTEPFSLQGRRETVCVAWWHLRVSYFLPQYIAVSCPSCTVFDSARLIKQSPFSSPKSVFWAPQSLPLSMPHNNQGLYLPWDIMCNYCPGYWGFANYCFPSLSLLGQLPENTIGKALRLLHERLSSKISNEVHVGTEGMVASAVETVPADSLLENGLHASAVRLGCDGLSLSAVNGVESNGILINSSI